MSLEGKTSVDPFIGRRLGGRFELVAFIDAGGMGRVYEAIQHPLNRRCAVKILDMRDAYSEAAQKRFYREACVSARLTHPNTVKIFDYGHEDDGIYFIAMEFLVGESLRHLSDREGALPPDRAAHILRQICSALSEAHESQLVHRDLKLSNIFLTTHGENTDFVKVLDFGLVIELLSDDRVTRSGIAVGSPMFMSPEQISAEEIDARTDVYALGVVAFILLTGKTPFELGGVLAVCMAHLTAEPLDVSDVELEWEVPTPLCQLVAKCLQKNPEDRFQTVDEIRIALGDCGYESSVDIVSLNPDAGPLSHWDEDDTLEIDISTALLSAFAFLDDPGVEASALLPAPIEETHERKDLEALRQSDLSEYVIYTDLNCPFCFALHERLLRWGVADALQWRLVEHSSHVIDGPLTVSQEEKLAKEVVSVHHRAPDVTIALPPRIFCARRASQLLLQVCTEFPDHGLAFRTSLYRAIWQDGLDVDDESTLSKLLAASGLPELTELSGSVDSSLLSSWQREWQEAEYDCSIPVIAHPSSGRYQIGLGTERSLIEFLSGERTRILDGAACYYQRRPVIMVGGSLSHIWPFIEHLRGCCEVIQVSNPDAIEDALAGGREPELMLLQSDFYSDEQLERVAQLARTLSILWVLVAETPSIEAELNALSMGASDYFTLQQDAEVARARLHRVLASRMTAEYLKRKASEDSLTRLPSRRSFLERASEEWERAVKTGGWLSFILIDLDHFKSFNWLGGYLNGNKRLHEIAETLRRVSRGGDYLARFGGNEFAFILPETSIEAARDESERMRSAIHQLSIKRPESGTPKSLTASVAVVSAQPLNGETFATVFERLDHLMNTAKVMGGNSVCDSGSQLPDN